MPVLIIDEAQFLRADVLDDLQRCELDGYLAHRLRRFNAGPSARS